MKTPHEQNMQLQGTPLSGVATHKGAEEKHSWTPGQRRLVAAFLESSAIGAEINAELVEASKAVVELLGKIPAFGDTIGSEISKAQLGAARNRLQLAIEETCL